ncbi:tyrosine-protein phosphatase non-receptor type 23 isoform X1 [Ahaetulla prasina]|uniref:tyrosine-protein phosphatase non-receptor type 23 isoform X1 n=1 Tax=Ahaetulla prasina TaxID=499056 RepID=UPI0026472C58|nr:tyrosine-protein phosphatase non-receptor type 23 isoform X1 [Ahaetulla prasina]
MEAVPRMPMIWLDLKEAAEFSFQPAVKKFVLKNYGENPEDYNEELKKLEQLRQNAVNVPRDFEGCSILRKYLGQLHYLQSRIPMGAEQEASVPITWTEIFSGKAVTHEDIKYEQACVLYNLGALHSMLGAMDKRVSEEGMKVSCTHFQCAAGAFTYLRDHFPHSYSVDMSHQILNLNINLMLGQAQECLLEKSMLDNRKSFLVARISAQVVDYYKEACRALENSDTASLLGKIQKDWKKLVQMKIYYFAAVAHLHMGKQAEEQQKYGERVTYFQSALDKLNEAIRLAKGQPETVQEALRFTMDVIGGKYSSSKKDNDFIYHEAVPVLDTLQSIKGASLVKALPVNPTDPAVTGPDIFAKLVPMAAHEASSLYSEEKAKLLRDVMAKIDTKNETLEQFMDSLQLDPETVDNLDMYDHIPPVLMEKCAALSVRPETVKNLVQSMQVLSGVFTDVEASLKDIKDLLEEDEVEEQKLRETLGKAPPPSPDPLVPSASGVAEVAKEWAKYLEVHQKASFTNTELHKAMNLHITNLRLLSGPLEGVKAALPAPSLSEDDQQAIQNVKRLLAKVQEMRDQRVSLEHQLREMIQKDDLTTSLVTTDQSEMKKLFAEQLKKYDQIKVYLEQNLAAQENILKALTEANVKYAAVRKILAEVEHKWNTTLQTLVASYEAYEDLMKKSQEGKEFYADLEGKVAKLLEKAQTACKTAETARRQIMEKEMKKKTPSRPTTSKPILQKKASEAELACEPLGLASILLADLPEELRSLPPEVLAAHLAQLPADALAALRSEPPLPAAGIRGPAGEAFRGGLPLRPPFDPGQFPVTGPPPRPYQPARMSTVSGQRPFPVLAPRSSVASPLPNSQVYPPGVATGRGPALAPHQPVYAGPPLPPPRTSPQHVPMSRPAPGPVYGVGSLAPSGGVLPGPPAPLAMRPPAPVPGHFVGPHFPPHAQGVRPATTTVDSLQAPISSCTAPQGMSGSLPQWAGPPSQGGFVGGPPGSAPYSFAYVPASTAPFLPPFSGTQPQAGFPPQGSLHPPSDRSACLQTMSTMLPSQQQVPHFLPQTQQPQPAFPQPYPSQPSGRPALPNPVPAHPASQGQLPLQLGPQHPLPPHSGSLAFSAPAPRGMMGPVQQVPLHPPGAAAPLAFAPTSAQIPGVPVGLAGPQPPPVNQPPLRHVPPAPSPVGGAVPPPAPSPRPSMTLPPPCLLPSQMPPSSLTPGPPSLPQVASEVPFQRQSSSTDDLLSSSPESQHGGPKAPVGQPLLQPTKADAKDGCKPKAVQLIENDPYEKPERLWRLLSELERFQEGVSRLEKTPAPGTVSELDNIWKELQDAQEKDARQLSIAIARCYTMKNRHQDIMPYDRNRVILQSGKDDYINASRIEDLSCYCPTIIATQAPLVGTASDFWLMIYEQKVSLVVMLVSEQEMEKQKVVRYFPTERSQPMVHGPITLVLTSLKATPTHLERMITLQFRDQSLKRTVIHLQFSSWPELGLPDSKGNLLRFIQDVHSHYLHQRPLHTPIVVHCSSGVGRTGAFCLLYAAMQEVEAGNSIPDLVQLVKRIRRQRKHMLQEKVHLRFCYEAVLKHALQVLQRHGVMAAASTSKPASSSSQKVYLQQDPQDLVLGGDVPISSIQATIAKLSIRPLPGGAEPPPNGRGLEVAPSVPSFDAALPPASSSAAPRTFPEPGCVETTLGFSPPVTPAPALPETAALTVETSSSVEEERSEEKVESLPRVEPLASTRALPTSSSSSSSSLELLASLTPEAFTLDSSLKGRHKVSKQSFLQPQNGEGLRGALPTDDPLSKLDPLWTLNKT